MAKSKLSNEDILAICNKYISTSKNMSDLAEEYHCSSSHISKSLHRAIALGIIDENKSKLIQQKSANNMDNKMREMRI